MDATYAVVNKPRRGGGANGQDPPKTPSPLSLEPAPYDVTALPSDLSPLRRPSPTASPHPSPSYEVIAPQGDARSSAHLGFNCRVAKPKGPREPPAAWSRV